MIIINLLPPGQTKRIKQMNIYRDIVSSCLIAFLLLLFLIIVMAGFLIFLNSKYLSTEESIIGEQAKVIQTDTVKTIERKVKDLNEELISVKEIYDKKSRLYNILESANDNLFKGIKIYNLEIDGKSNLIVVSGRARYREDLLAIKKILEENTQSYKNIDFPLSNLANPRDINFKFSFVYISNPNGN